MLPVPIRRERCASPVSTPDQLGQLFVTEPGGIVGADYQRATPLSNGSVLWTFQDAEVRLPNGSTTLVHNIGMVQRGNCFTVLMSGTAADPQPWLFASSTTKFAHWYWPLGAEMGVDGRVYVFMAEMVELGPGYLTRVEPIATVVAGVDIDDLDVEFYGAPANAGPSLYGWSIESDGTWTYLYAQCHRQFGFDPYIYVYAHDTQCSSIVTRRPCSSRAAPRRAEILDRIGLVVGPRRGGPGDRHRGADGERQPDRAREQQLDGDHQGR